MVLIDKFNRTIDLLEIAVSRSCQYGCAHCRTTKDQQDKELFSTRNILSFIGLMAKLGLKRVRLIGGEPLLRPDIMELVHGLVSVNPSLSVSLATNGKLLESFASELADERLCKIFVTLPTLDPTLFKSITGHSEIEEIMGNLERAISHNALPITIKMALLPGVNDHEIEPMIDWAVDRGLDLYLIETKSPAPYPDGAENILLNRLQKRYQMSRITGAAISNNPWKLEGSETKIKIITRTGRCECKSCNRMWLTPDGILSLCHELSFALDLNDLFENNPTEAEIAEFAMKIALNKPAGIQDFELTKT
ncbi:hypothetical protein MNBD_NITROSPINAE03-1308 [hydrothermal vent metagenome]|uniref:Radical SAM core domain-containing protein n=1 Tax=hydrothermal vent metagenome TaxID=652676 RepID=A0A3B1CU02_9ZZZZ